MRDPECEKHSHLMPDGNRTCSTEQITPDWMYEAAHEIHRFVSLHDMNYVTVPAEMIFVSIINKYAPK